MSMTQNGTQDLTAYTAPRTLRQRKGAGWFWDYQGTTTAGKLLYRRDGQTIELSRDDIGQPGQGRRFTNWDE